MKQFEIPPKVLIVDDEVIPRRMLTRYLSNAGFRCVTASNAADALKSIGSTEFDLVVSDLRMPGRNGHSLIVELLEKEKHPLIAVHTTVTEPRITEDLMTRGVSDVVYKPTNYEAFARKMRGLISQHRAANKKPSGSDQRSPDHKEAHSPSRTPKIPDLLKPVSMQELDASLVDASHMLPLSKPVLSIVDMLSNDEALDTDAIVHVIRHEPALCCEVIKAANRAVRSKGRRSTLKIDEAVKILGGKRTGEIAITIGALQALTGTIVPWLNTETLRLRGVAAHIALGLLAAHSSTHTSNDGLEMSAIIHGMGRLLLGSLFPHHYKKMVAFCLKRKRDLSEIEALVFPVDHFTAMTMLLNKWGLDNEPFTPLKHAGRSFESLEELPPRLREQTKLLKTAILVGQSACDQWSSWERPEVPDPQMLSALGTEPLDLLVSKVKDLLLVNEQRAELAAVP